MQRGEAVEQAEGHQLDRSTGADVGEPAAALGPGESRTQQRGLITFTPGTAQTGGKAGDLEPGGPQLRQASSGRSLCSAACFHFTCFRIRICLSRSRVRVILFPALQGDLQGSPCSYARLFAHTYTHDGQSQYKTAESNPRIQPVPS